MTAAEPVYRQIAAQLRVLIVEGALRPGDALPPVRRVARDLAVHFNTVAEAFRMVAETRARGLPASRIRKELKSLMEALEP